jgi:hypothetical protein
MRDERITSYIMIRIALIITSGAFVVGTEAV